MHFQFRELDTTYLSAATEHLRQVLAEGASSYYQQLAQKVDFCNTGYFYIVVYDRIDDAAFIRGFGIHATYMSGLSIHEAADVSPVPFPQSNRMGLSIFFDHILRTTSKSILAAESWYDDWNPNRNRNNQMATAIYPDGNNTLFILSSCESSVDRVESFLQESNDISGYLGVIAALPKEPNIYIVDELIAAISENARLLYCHIFGREGGILWSKDELLIDRGNSIPRLNRSNS